MKILTPKEDSFWIRDNSYYGYFFGPFHDSGEPYHESGLALEQKFVQGAGLYGENSVFHSKADGSVVANNLLSSLPMPPSGGSVKYSLPTRRNTTSETGLLHPGLMNLTEAKLEPAPGKFTLVTRKGNSNEYTVLTGFSVQLKKDSHGLNIIKTHYNILRTGDYTVNTQQNTTLGWYPDKKREPWSEGEIYAVLEQSAGDGPFGPIVNQSRNKLVIPGDLRFNPTAIRDWTNRKLRELNLLTPALPGTESYGDLVHQASKNINPNTINAIAFIKDLKDVKELVPKLKELRKISTHASNYLGVEYGVLPTIDDLKTIFESFSTPYFYDQNGYQRASAYDKQTTSGNDVLQGLDVTVSTSHERRVHLAINTHDTGLDALVEKARRLGIFPSLTNLWDLIPYSFVLDWFIDVGDVLERIDLRHQLFNLDIKYCILSDKYVTHYSLFDPSGINMELMTTRYQRDVTTSVPQPLIFGGSTITAQDHWIEGSALILSRKTK